MAIPVYMFAGFLESGKTSFIASVLQDPGFTRDENTLIVQCEEGENGIRTRYAQKDAQRRGVHRGRGRI